MRALVFLMAVPIAIALFTSVNAEDGKTSATLAANEVNGLKQGEKKKLGVSDLDNLLAWTSVSVNLDSACDLQRMGVKDPKFLSMQDAEQDVDTIIQYALATDDKKLLKMIVEKMLQTEKDRRSTCSYSKLKASFETAKMLKR